VAHSEAPETFVYQAQGGWTEPPGKTFVLPDGAISEENTNIFGVSPSYAMDDPRGRRKTSGSLTSWRDTVGQTALLSSLFMFTISVAFAAPLLAITRRQSFGFCIYGKTRSGKTIATCVGCSVIGIGLAEHLIGWNITDSRLEERLAEFNDLIFPIDDLSSMTGRSREKYGRLRNITYRISQGAATGRHSSFATAHGGAQSAWRTIVVTSAEKSIRDMASEAKTERQGGEGLRMIDLPAILDGSSHLRSGIS
jgi:putative DNA primase/helicase